MTSTELTIFGIICTTVGAIIGYFVNNKLAISRDKRKEFNTLVDPWRRNLMFIKKHPNHYLTGNWEIIFSEIREYLPFWKRKGFDRAIEAYKESNKEYHRNRQSDGMGGFIDGDRSAISHTAYGLLKYLKPK